MTREVYNKVFDWYLCNGRSLPWRHTKNHYRILLSEIMLQQTQVNRVLVFYKNWLKKYPTFLSLAKAKKANILRQWSGLGYNNRALRLHTLSQIVSDKYSGKLPSTIEGLQELPGIGKYTAHAVACFAFRQNVPVVDVNVKRIFTRFVKKIKFSSEMKSEKEVWELAEKFLPHQNAFVWNQALMDIGATICSISKPRCQKCPFNKNCASAFSEVFLSSHDNATSKKKEPSYKGIPRRIYRGRILKMLHYEELSSKSIAQLLWNTPNEKDMRWVFGVLEKLVKDGLIAQKGKTKFSIV